ncbi:MAG: hypothetical protein HC936_16175, partial [Leptolyngbyaceae cyanobacterium SU_3_3]|nr:hypothetical protein [Leptolyngbyaceae cyanobacterium SU_3_3]
MERSLAGLVDHRLAGNRIQLRDDVVAMLAAYQNPAHRPVVADADLEAAAIAAPQLMPQVIPSSVAIRGAIAN